jgi:insulysin
MTNIFQPTWAVPTAYTTGISTIYHFDVAAHPANDQDTSDCNPSPVREALDRFAKSFAEPLFLYSTFDRG